jgi:hypothetical protein
MKPIFGGKAANWAQAAMPELKMRLKRKWDRTMFAWQARKEPQVETAREQE